MKYNVTEITVEFSKGSFEEWANGTEPQAPENVERWKSAYNEEIKTAIKEVYPHAEIEVSESYDQTTSTKIYTVTAPTTEAEADYEIADDNEWAIEHAHFDLDDKIKGEVDAIIARVSDAGTFWDA